MNKDRYGIGRVSHIPGVFYVWDYEKQTRISEFCTEGEALQIVCRLLNAEEEKAGPMNNAELTQWIREQIANLRSPNPDDPDDERHNAFKAGAEDAYEHVIRKILYEERKNCPPLQR